MVAPCVAGAIAPATAIPEGCREPFCELRPSDRLLGPSPEIGEESSKERIGDYPTGVNRVAQLLIILMTGTDSPLARGTVTRSDST